MSVPTTRISNATINDIIIYDPAAEKRAKSLCVNWDTYFNIGSNEILIQMEWGWWPKYVQTAAGAYLYQNNAQGQLVTAFNPSLLVKSDQTLIRLDVFKAVEEFYKSLVTDASNINEVDKTNYNFAKARFENEWSKAIETSNWYDLYQDGVITKLEENYLADMAYYNGDRRYM